MTATATRRQSITDRYMAEFANSRKSYEQAKKLFPSGVTHDLRYLEPFPPYVERAKGSHKWDIDDHELIDYWAGHGSLLLGHCPNDVVAAVRDQVGKSTHPGACHELEIEWAEWIRKLMPSIEKVRFTASGTEATMMAARIVRAATGRPKILKFTGHFHGWNDSMMPGAYQPYDGVVPPGIPCSIADNTVVIDPNDPDKVEQVLRSDSDIGGIILEPTGGHWGIVPVRGPFLRALRELCDKYQRILIFDEVITGFRVSPGGAQEHYRVRPDLTSLAKIVAGGLPGGCLGGRADLMDQIALRPGQPKLRHPGTYNANPLSAVAGIAALKQVATGEPSRMANESAAKLKSQLNKMFAERDFNWVCYGDLSMLHLLPDYDGPRPAEDDFIPYDGCLEKLEGIKNPTRTQVFRQAMLLNGVDVSGFGMFLSTCHTDDDLLATVNAVETSIEALRQDGLEY